MGGDGSPECRPPGKAMSPMPYVAVSALSHAGLIRGHNEDSLAIGPWTLCSTETESPQTLLFPLGTPLLVAVADGLGGHPGGEVASALVVRRLARVGPLLTHRGAGAEGPGGVQPGDVHLRGR